MLTRKDFELFITRMARMNMDFLTNAFEIKEEFPEIIDFVDNHKYEFHINSSFYNSTRKFTNMEALVIEKLFRDIFDFTQKFIDADEDLSQEELSAIYEESQILEFLDDWYKTQGMKN